MKKVFIIFLGCSIALGSCSIERRLYRPGLSIQWHSIKKDKAQDPFFSDVMNSEVAHDDHQPEASAETYGSAKEFNDAVLPMVEVVTEEEEQIVYLTNGLPEQHSNNDDTTRVSAEAQDNTVYDDVYHPQGIGNKYGWVYILLFIVLFAILGAVLYVGALYPFYAGVMLLFPLSFLFGLEDRAGFLFGIFSGLAYIGLYFLVGTIGFWGIFFLGILAMLISILLATYLDDLLDRGEKKDDLPPPPPPPQMNPGDDW